MATPVPVVIETVGLAHADLLAGLMEACFPPEFGERWRPDDMAGTLALAGVTGLVARSGAQPVGFALIRAAADEAELLLIGVLPAGRQAGIGKALLAAVEGAAQHAGARWLFLEMRTGNQAARRLYDRAGFTAVGARPGYYRSGDHVEDAITLRKDIGAGMERM